MRIAGGTSKPSWIAVLCLLLAGQGLGKAQDRPAQASPDQARRALVDKAHALETRGRPDMAVQSWQQILLSDPNNVEALEGLARDCKLIGSNDLANDAIARLRKVNPNDPNIAKIEGLSSTRVQNDQLRQAGDLARQGKPDQAMRVYRSLFGDHPPDGEIALAFYDTMYGTDAGKDQAIAGMRALAQRNPGDMRFSVALGRMLTYQSKTRSEGIRILQAYPKDANAQVALRQALIWDAANPSSAAQLRQFVKEHPQDKEIAGRLKENESKLAEMSSVDVRSPLEREAYEALNAKKLKEAQALFYELLQKDPNNGRAAAGMGFLRMQQNNFAGAISYLTQAEQSGDKDKSVEAALATSRFWMTMGEASQAVNDNQLDEAAARYRAALDMRPGSPEALSGLAGLLMREKQYAQAAEIYGQLAQVQSASPETWRRLFLAYARAGENQQALAAVANLPEAVKTALGADPEYLRTLAAVYRAENRNEESQRVLAQALFLPFANNGAGMKMETRLEYAGILMESNRFDQAAELYTLMLQEDSANLSAWMGLVSAQHQLKRDQLAIAEVEKMPPSTYESALSDPGFLTMLGSIYQQANQLEIAQSLLERASKIEVAGGHEPSVELQLQLAGIDLARSNTAQAYRIYHQLLIAHPDRVDAWKGLIATLQATNHVAAATQEISLIPPQTRKALESDVEFNASESALYAANGDSVRALQYMNRVQSHYALTGTAPPATVAIQNAWLLLNTRNDRNLYPALMALGGRQDLTAAQRETVENIWANWSVRRAEAATSDGNPQRAKDLLDAAFQAFPDNPAVRKAVANGYLTAGRAHEALVIFKTIPLQDAPPADYQGAVGSALAANDLPQAETWLRQALARYAADPAILAMAARFEQARGNNQRAADYWRASLAAMPPPTATEKLAHELAYPEQQLGVRRAATPADLSRLLNPENDPYPRTTRLPPLPAYGPDPYAVNSPVAQYAQPAPMYPQTYAPQPARQIDPQNQWNAAPVQTVPPAGSPLSQSNDIYAPGAVMSAYAPATPQLGSWQPQEQYATTTPVAEAQAATETAMTEPAMPVFIPKLPNQKADRRKRTVVTHDDSSDLPEPVQFATTRERNSDLRIPTEIAGTRNVTSDLPSPNEIAEAQFTAQIASRAEPPAYRPKVVDRTPQPDMALYEPDPKDGGAIASQPVEQMPAFNEASSSASPALRLGQGSDASIRSLANAPISAAPLLAAAPAQRQATQPAAPPVRQQSPSVPTLMSAPGTQSGAPGDAQAVPQIVPQIFAAAPPAEDTAVQIPFTGTGITDQQLQDRSLPPLRGSWLRVEREKRPVTPQDEAETQLQSIESGYSSWLGGTGMLNYRSGALGFDHLSALESPLESSMPFGYNARMTFIAKPVFLDSGQADGTAVASVNESTTAGSSLVAIPQPLGTDVNTGPSTTSTSTSLSIPPQQNAGGVGGEVQLAWEHLAIAGGYTPWGFLVANATARANWRPNNGPFTLSFIRDSVKDSQLSYAGLRDPGTSSLGHEGQVWGGVMSNQGNLQYSRGDAQSGFYLGAGGQYITGTNVRTNNRFDGSGGSYWRVLSDPSYGNLSLGVNFFAMHYANNQLAYTFGMGGYFSPQSYFLANIPFTWNGHSGSRWRYNILGSFGVQAFQEDSEPLWPLAADSALEIAEKNAALPEKTSVGPNYDLRAQTAYQISPNWYAGGFLGANNARNYTSASVGFYVRYLFKPQVEASSGPTGIFPADGFRPFRVP